MHSSMHVVFHMNKIIKTCYFLKFREYDWINLFIFHFPSPTSAHRQYSTIYYNANEEEISMSNITQNKNCTNKTKEVNVVIELKITALFISPPE